MAEKQIIVHRTLSKETRVQNRIIWAEDLSPLARFSLIAMLSLPETWDYSVRGMAKMLKVSSLFILLCGLLALSSAQEVLSGVSSQINDGEIVQRWVMPGCVRLTGLF